MFKALTAIIGAIGITVAGVLLFGNKKEEKEPPMRYEKVVRNNKVYDKIYVLIMRMYDPKTDTDSDWDVIGLYSSLELADIARKSLLREDGFYEGCTPQNIYNMAVIVKRLVDHNLPEE